MVHICNPSAEGPEISGYWSLIDSGLASLWAPGPDRNAVSKKQDGEWSRKTTVVNHRHPHVHVYTCMCLYIIYIHMHVYYT